MLRSKITVNGVVIEVEASDAKELATLVQSLQSVSVASTTKKKEGSTVSVEEEVPVLKRAYTKSKSKSKRNRVYVSWTDNDLQLVGDAVIRGSEIEGDYYTKYVNPAIEAIRESGDLKSRSINSIRQKTQEIVAYLVTGTKRPTTQKTKEALNKPFSRGDGIESPITPRKSYLQEA